MNTATISIKEYLELQEFKKIVLDKGFCMQVINRHGYTCADTFKFFSSDEEIKKQLVKASDDIKSNYIYKLNDLTHRLEKKENTILQLQTLINIKDSEIRKLKSRSFWDIFKFKK